jgi:hypothetical protein
MKPATMPACGSPNKMEHFIWNPNNVSNRGNRMFPLDAVAYVAEQKIREAAREGAFDDLPGAGKPLVLEDLSHLPPEMRMAYTILKNSGFIATRRAESDCPPDRPPDRPEEELRRSSPGEGATNARLRRLDVLIGRVRRAKGQGASLPLLFDSPYLDKLLKRV